MMHPLILFEPRSQDGVPRIHKDTCPTLNTAQGGQRQPCVAKPAYCVQGNCIDRSDKAGCNGKGWREGASFTLNTIDRPAVIYAVDQGGGKSGVNIQDNISPTLTCTHGGEPAVAHLASGKDKVGTLLANAGTKQWLGNQEAFSGDYHVIEKNKIRYIVRRLTPTECARLQGFADGWGIPDYKEDFTEEEYLFWLEVRNTYALINGKKTKEYSKEQMLTWYNKLHSDSSEYKMWGNGIALPPTLYCMQGICAALLLRSEGAAVDDNKEGCQ